jgi:hypothetical protein
MNSKIILALVCIIFITSGVFAQYQFGPKQTDYRRDLRKYQNNPVQSYGLGQLNTLYTIGRESDPYIQRAVYQWDIPDNEIPDNSQIDFVKLTFTYSKLGHSIELPANFYKISYDMISEDYLDEMFAEMNYTVQEIGYQMGSNNQITFESTGSGQPFNLAIKNMLPNNKFMLGVKWANDHSTYNYEWGVSNFSINLYIEFTPPTQQVTVDQKLPDNTSIDSVGLYNFSDTRFDKFSVPQTFIWDVGSNKTLQGSQKLLNYNKYEHWKVNFEQENNIVNHKTFEIFSYTNNLTSRFNPTQDLIKIQNSLEGTTVDGGKVEFADPWFIDYPDPSFPKPGGGYYERNRGMKQSGPDALVFYERNSPFSPNWFTPYDGRQYKGVFLNQDPSQTPTYYKVGMPTEQTISVNGQERKFFPFKWQNDGGVTFQDEYARQTGVVFTTTNATATALLKGQLMSNDQNGVNSNKF